MPAPLTLFLLTGLLFFAGLFPLQANPGHEISIAELTETIARNGPSPDLLFQRAVHHREAGNPAACRADLEAALQLQREFLPAIRELAATDALHGDTPGAITRLEAAIRDVAPSQKFHLPGCHRLLSELLLRENRNKEALDAANAGLEAAADLQLDLVLLRSEAQRRLGHLTQRATDLEGALGSIRSFVIRMKWYDAMIDAGSGNQILPVVDQEIENTRFKASWRIRRARILLAPNPVSGPPQPSDPTGANEELQAAFAEIQARLRPVQPDLSLICERGSIRALQGNFAAARADLFLAQSLGADFWMTLPLVALLPP